MFNLMYAYKFVTTYLKRG